jgi:hypothetical protein
MSSCSSNSNSYDYYSLGLVSTLKKWIFFSKNEFFFNYGIIYFSIVYYNIVRKYEVNMLEIIIIIIGYILNNFPTHFYFTILRIIQWQN